MPLRPGEPFGRYRIEVLLGEGGMGQVYRARDEHLRRRVALKVISAAPGTDGTARLLREARAAAAIDHPSAVAIFDVGEVEGTPFLAMELVEGETLRRHVREGGVPVAQRLQWLLAIARALAAAHDRGIVHRDIKPENVMVRFDGLVKVLDFGIARAFERPREASAADEPASVAVDAATSLTSTASKEGAIVGTPLYMSPEQLRRDSLDGRSDQFAWGVVAWELLGGRLPWSVERGGASAIQEILTKDPGPVPANEGVGAAVQAVIARAMRKSAAERFETTAALVSALEGALGVDAPLPVLPTRGSVSPTARTLEAGWTRTLRTRRSLGVAGALVLAVAAGVVAWRVYARRPADDAMLAMLTSGRRPAVAVVGAPASGGDPGIGALPDLLATELATGDQIRVVPREVVARAVGDGASSSEPQVMARLRDVADADYVLFATPGASGGSRVTLAVRVVTVPRVGAPSRTAEIRADGDASDPAAIASRAGEEVRRVLGRPPLPAEDVAALRAAMPKSTAAAEAYAEGLASRARYDDAGALEAFQRAVAAEDDFALAHLELSRALTRLGFDRRALDEATRAMELSAPLGREQRLLIVAQHAVAAKDWSTATETYRALFDFFPDNLDYGIWLSRSQVYLGKRDEAFATLDRLRSVPRTSIDEARLDLVEAFVAAKTGDVHRRLSASLEAKRKADALGAAWIAADARTGIAEAYRDLGQIDQGTADLDEAAALFDRLGDRSGLAGVLRQRADVAEAHGDYAGAIALLDRALVLARQVGDRYRTGGLITSRGIVLARVGRFGEACAAFDEARALYESIQDVEGVAHNTGNAAEMRIARGELAGARAAFERALAMHRQIGMKLGIAGQTLNVGWALYLEGRVDDAGKMLAEAVADWRAASDEGGLLEALVKQAQWLRARDDPYGAERDEQEAAALAAKARDLDSRAEVDLAEARMALDRPAGGDAEARARAALARFVDRKLPHDEALARAVLVRALVRRGGIDDAAREAASLDAAVASTESFEARFEAGLARAELAGARGDRAGALGIARDTREMAESAGFVPRALEARLVEAKLTAGAARPSALASVARDARAAGFLRVARLASGDAR